MVPEFKFKVRPAEAFDFHALKPMLLDMGFVEDEAALAARFPSYTALKNRIEINSVFPNGVSERKYGFGRRVGNSGAFPRFPK